MSLLSTKKKSPSLRSAKSGVSARLFEKFAAVFVLPFIGSNPGAEEDQEEQAKEAAGSRRASFLQAWRFLGTWWDHIFHKICLTKAMKTILDGGWTNLFEKY